MAEMTLKEYALYYAKMGLAVFPLVPRGKKPATVNGCKAATMDPVQIAAWWDSTPDFNIGIATGSVSGGLVVIDLDRDEDKGIDGYEVLKNWQRENGELPETSMSITGRGGYHYFYKDAAQWKNKVGLYEGVDIRGEGGYVVAPPSIHPNGRCYEWEQEPLVYGFAEVDSLVSGFLIPPVLAGEGSAFQMSEQIPEGQRTSTMVRLVGSLRAKGLDNEAIKAAVQAENEKKCVPPLTFQELEKTVFPTLNRGWQVEKPYTAVLDKGKFRAAKETPKLSVTRLAEIEETTAEWVWFPRIPKKKITILQGEPGSGKTTLLCQLIADITTGNPFPGDADSYSMGNPFQERPPMRVLYQITEDDFSSTIKPRLRKAGADMTKIFNIDESEAPLTFGDPRIREVIDRWGIEVAVFDPLMSYVGADVQLNMGNAARAEMNHLINIGNETGCTFLIVAHTSKQTSAGAINRLIGSIDFVSSCRSLITMGKDPKDPSIKAIAHTKSNLGPLAPTILFKANHDGNNGRLVEFLGHSSLTSDEIIAPPEPRRKPSFALDEAKEFLQDLLKDGYATTKEMNDAAAAAGINRNSLYKAKDELKIRSKQYGGGKGGAYWWIMPGREVPERLRQSYDSRNQ